MDEILAPFRVFYVDAARGSDTNDGISLDNPLSTLAEAHDRMTAGQDDIACIVGDGTTTGSTRLPEALTWSKNACHIIGLGPRSYNPRARISTLSGAATFADFITVTASGCKFKNFSIFNDNAIAAQRTWVDRGGRNEYEDVFFGGMGDATSAHDTGSRVLVLGGTGASGENRFRRCTIGLDTSLGAGRDVANATIEFAGGSKRNVFEDCLIVASAKATTMLHILSSGVNPLETFQMFRRCCFHNPYPQSSALLMAAVATLAANGNGRLIMEYCTRFGATKWGTDATSLAQIYELPASGIGVVAS
jgi:hypothetical protein